MTQAEAQERINKRIEELMSGINAGDFNDPYHIPDKYTYDHLLALYVYNQVIENGSELYLNMYRLVTAYATQCVRKRYKKNSKVTVIIEVISASQWACEDIYRTLNSDPRFDISILVLPQTTLEGDDSVKRYQACYKYFADHGYNVKGGMDVSSGKIYSFDELGGYPDIAIHSSPWFESFPEELVITALPLTTLNISINYGICVADNPEGTYLAHTQFNKSMHNMVWRCYAHDLYEMQCYKQYQFLKGENVRFTGYAKMDRMYEHKDFSDDDYRRLWAIPEGKDPSSFKKLIVAPHFTVGFSGLIHYSTFHMNMNFLL